MSSPDRFDIIVPLHEVAGWRRALAVDRGGVAPRAVVLSYPPSALTDDPTRLVGLMRDAEAAALVHHPNALPALGLETSGDLLVAVEAYRRGVPLRTLLDVARKLPPELAVRVAVDACAALAAVHGVDPGDGHLLVHGDVSPARLLVADDGSTLLCGTGTAGGGEPGDDVRAVAAVLHECLLGAPPAPVPAPVDDPFMPQPLAEVLGRALGATPSAPYATPEALADALTGALSPAPPEALAAYLEAILPAGEGERGELLRLVAHGLSRAAARAPGASEPARPVEAAPRAVAPGPGADPEPLAAAPAAASTPAPPPAAATPAREHVPEAPHQAPAAEAPDAPPAPARATGASFPGPGTAPAAPGPGASDVAASASALQPVAPQPSEPAAPRSGQRSRLVAAVAVAMAVLGFGGGYLVSRSRAPASAAPPAVVAATPAPAPVQPAPPAAAPPLAAPPSPAPAPSAEPAPAPAPRAASAASIEVSSEPPGEIYVDGKRVGRSPLTVPVSRGDHEVRLRSKYEGVDVRRRVTVRGPGTPVRFALRRGALKVRAPEDAEVFVDGRRVGKGDVRVELWEGDHVVEARLGEARVQERFTVGPGETWTYDVTPTK